MSRTPTLPMVDKTMWRKLIAASHPDRSGDHKLCVWTQGLREHVIAGETRVHRRGPPHRGTPSGRSSPLPRSQTACPSSGEITSQSSLAAL